MTDICFFDTDCISSFLWIKRVDVVFNVIKGRILLPQPVYEELKKVSFLLDEFRALLEQGKARIIDIEYGSNEYKDYLRLTRNPDSGMKVIGKGEAAAIALAKNRNGVIASNNLKDILFYVKKYHLQYITTADIMTKALQNNFITEEEGNIMWSKMIKKKRRLPYESFSEYLISEGYKHNKMQ